MTSLAILELNIRLGGRNLREGAGLPVRDGRRTGLIGRYGYDKR